MRPTEPCRCCSCHPDQVDAYCRAHGGPAVRQCDIHRFPGRFVTGHPIRPVSVQAHLAGAPDRPKPHGRG